MDNSEWIKTEITEQEFKALISKLYFSDVDEHIKMHCGCWSCMEINCPWLKFYKKTNTSGNQNYYNAFVEAYCSRDNFRTDTNRSKKYGFPKKCFMLTDEMKKKIDKQILENRIIKKVNKIKDDMDNILELVNQLNSMEV